MAEIRHLENRHDVIFFCWGWSDLDKISQTGAEWHVDYGDIVKIETRWRIPIWRTFGWIPWHVIPQPPAALQGVIIASAILKIVFRHILFLNAVWALTSGGFRIVSDTLVLRRVIQPVCIARQHSNADARFWYRNYIRPSVCLSVRNAPVLYRNLLNVSSLQHILLQSF